MDTENLTLNAWLWKQSPWNRTLALKQNAERLISDPERLSSDPERLTDPKRFNINAENANIVAENMKLNVRILILDAKH